MLALASAGKIDSSPKTLSFRRLREPNRGGRIDIARRPP